MIRTELFEKNTIAHCFIYSSTNPNTLIPVKVYIKDVKFYESGHKYKVKIMKFYDNAYFIKKNMFGKAFQNKFDTRTRNLTFSKSDFKSTEEIVDYMYKEDHEKYYFIVDSFNMVKHKKELSDLFNKLQDFFIIKNIKQFRDNCTRHLYTGKFKMSSKTEFNNRLKSSISDKVSKSGKDWDDFVDLIS